MILDIFWNLWSALDTKSYTFARYIPNVQQTIACIRLFYISVDIFEKRLKYGVSVWQSRHSEVNNYIERVLDNSKLLLEHVIVVYFFGYVYRAH